MAAIRIHSLIGPPRSGSEFFACCQGCRAGSRVLQGPLDPDMKFLRVVRSMDPDPEYCMASWIRIGDLSLSGSGFLLVIRAADPDPEYCRASCIRIWNLCVLSGPESCWCPWSRSEIFAYCQGCDSDPRLLWPTGSRPESNKGELT